MLQELITKREEELKVLRKLKKYEALEFKADETEKVEETISLLGDLPIRVEKIKNRIFLILE